MPEVRRAANDWASARRRRWSASRIAAALALHALLLVALTLAIDRVELPRRGQDRATKLVTVTLHQPAPPPHALPSPRTLAPSPAHAAAPAPARANAPARTPAPPREDDTHAITLPAPRIEAPPPVAAASAPAADLKFLDSAATRQAIRAVARGDTLASAGNALTHEDGGSELVAADGSHAGMKRNLPIASSAVALAQGVDAAHKGDCGKGEYLGGGMGLLSAPFLLAAEALGKCSSK
jgi:hypothetical protein